MKKTIAAVMAGMAMSASAGLVTEYNNFVTAGKAADAVSLGASIAADAGDVIVFSASSSKSYVKAYSVTSGDGGAVGAESGVWLDKNVTVSYFNVTAGGTFDLGAAGNADTFDSFGAYVLGSDLAGGSVAELATATTFVSNHTNSTLNQLDYGTLASGGIVVEGAQGNSIVSYPAGLNASANGADSRASVYGSFSAGALTSDYIIGGDLTKNSRAAGIAFSEVIPEPATLGLIVTFGAGTLFVRRRFML